MDRNSLDVLIIGAGMAGLTAARQVASAGLDVVVIEKGRSVGGRLATRRIDSGVADHGAQFFTVRSPQFAAFVETHAAAGDVFEWSRGWSDGSLATTRPDGYPRYAVRGGFNQLPKDMARGLSIRLSEQVAAVGLVDCRWRATAESGTSYSARALVLTPPVPQSVALLDAGEASLSASTRAALETVSYAPCLCGLFVVHGTTTLPEPGALQRPDQDISWIADNQRKGISPGARVITVHAGPEASAARWDDAEAAVLDWLEDGLQPFLTPGSTVEERQLKRWRYALPVQIHSEVILVGQTDPLLVFAGDAFGSMRVEGAFLSGLAAGQYVRSNLG